MATGACCSLCCATLSVACLLIAVLTVQLNSVAGFSSFRCNNPRAVHPGRLVADMLLMPALQIRDPVLMLVPVKADDLPFQCLTPSLVDVSGIYSGLLRMYPVLVKRRETGLHQKMMESEINQQTADDSTSGRSTR